MKIKFTWGTGIFITIAVFVTFFISFIIFSLTEDVNLVTKDYFPDEIAYDVKIKKIENTNKLKDKIKFTVSEKVLKITFPEEIKDPNKIKGSVLFYFIKSFRKDIKYKINLNTDKEQYFDLSNLPEGRYTVKIDWSYNNKDFFQEKTFELK